MTYDQTLQYLYSQTPMYQRVGGDAYKPGLGTSLMLDQAFGSPHRSFRSIHVAGTNGKGSVSHSLAAILMKSGYRVGLYTSPHLIDFRERVRVDGEMIPRQEVTQFVERYLKAPVPAKPSFFELTMTMAFDYFARRQVDFAVVEVGLGGRLDSTNIISPILSIITNISLDHTQFLGDTLPQIAAEKAGIIKPGVPVVIGEAAGQVRQVMERKAAEQNAPATFAQDTPEVLSIEQEPGRLILHTASYGQVAYGLTGYCQKHNANTILRAVTALKKLGVEIPDKAVADGMAGVCRLTGLMGRWMQVASKPLIICDTGHNIGGFEYIAAQLRSLTGGVLHVVIGFVADKDVGHILPLLPKSASYYFTQASIPRAMPAERLAGLAARAGLKGSAHSTVATALAAARSRCGESDTIFVGGSTFVVADLLSLPQFN